MRGEIVEGTETLVVEQCCNCFVYFAMPERLYEKALSKRGPNGVQFYCPQGHSQHYTGKSDKEKMKDLESLLAMEKDNAKFWREQEEKVRREKAAVKGVLTKTKKRIAKGVCPCCNRHFDNIQAHMEGEHPEWVEAVDEKAK